MDEIKIENIIRSKRKTIALEVTGHCTLIVRAPFYVPNKAIDEVIKRHIKWIEKRVSKIKTMEKPAEKEFVSGESFFYLGRQYRLFILKEQNEILKFDNGFYLRKDKRPLAREIFTLWYKKAAKEFINQRVLMYSKLIGLKINDVKITSAQKRWGSCSRNGNVSFSYRLVAAPIPVIDYVVVHELCHIVEHNHSKTFWEKIKVTMPDYELQKNWLKEKGHLLSF